MAKLDTMKLLLKYRLVAFMALMAVSLSQGYKVSYENYSVLRTGILDRDSAGILRQLQNDESGFDFWRPASPGLQADIMASPETVDNLKAFLHGHGIDFTVMIQDVEQLAKSNSKKASGDDIMTWDRYYDHDQLNKYVDHLAAKFPDFVKSHVIGQSFEGRDMKVLQILKAGPTKPNIWIEAGIHAREWIAPAMATYIMHELLETPSGYLDHLNFHILVSANPDGYMYSRTSDRYWRKTRSPNQSVWGCKGTDGNRNWPFHWGEGDGASEYPCDSTYRGPKAFSEVEMRNIRDYLLNLPGGKPILTVNLHSYSQLWLYAFGYSVDAVPDNVEEIRELGAEAVKAVAKVHGTEFTLKQSARLYEAPGDSEDWYKGVLGSRFTYTVELRDTGYHGFDLPEDQIIPSGEELWAGFKVLFDRMVHLSSAI